MKNNRGFTLIEMIIVMAIIGIVSSVGYTIINNSNNLMNENKITNDGQQSIKILNRYLSKDLEQCENIVINGAPSNNIGEYSISLEINDGSNPKYLVKTYKYRGKLCYQITRQVNGGNIGLVENQIITSDENIIPLEILKSGNIYEVKICYGDNDKIKIYNFKVSSRYSEIILSQTEGGVSQTPGGSQEEGTQIPENPEIDEEMEGQHGFIRFKINEHIDKNKDETESYRYSMNALIGSSNPNADGTYKTYVDVNSDNISNVIETKTIISTNNNNGKCTAQIKESEKKWQTADTQQQDFGKMDVNQINVLIEGDITYNLKVEMKGANGGGSWSKEYDQLITSPGKYHFPVPVGKDIIITGTITKKDNSTGMAVITFGKKKTN